LKGFEGEINQAGSAVMKVQLHWEYQTISRGGGSLYEELRKDPNIPDPFKFVRFYGLRTHALDRNNMPKTEMIYVHSKVG
jgi:phospholipase D1/2